MPRGGRTGVEDGGLAAGDEDLVVLGAPGLEHGDLLQELRSGRGRRGQEIEAMVRADINSIQKKPSKCKREKNRRVICRPH